MAWDDEEETPKEPKELIRANEKKNAEGEETEYVFNFIDDAEKWRKEWKGMPEYVQEDLEAWKSLIVNFENREDMNNFSALIGKKITFETKSTWFPVKEAEKAIDKRWVDETPEEKI